MYDQKSRAGMDSDEYNRSPEAAGKAYRVVKALYGGMINVVFAFLLLSILDSSISNYRVAPTACHCDVYDSESRISRTLQLSV